VNVYRTVFYFQALDFQYNLNDAIAVLPKLQTGLDVNVKFTGMASANSTWFCNVHGIIVAVV